MKEYKRDCPGCGKSLSYERPHKLQRAITKNSKCSSCAQLGKSRPESDRQKISRSVKLAMTKPDVKKKVYDSLVRTKYLKVRTDSGQLELLKRWNDLGFCFEPNYQLHTDDFLCYIDGYDKTHNVVLEYDGKYHKKIEQQRKDLVRQQQIIRILNPKRFWRYDSESKQFRSIL